MVALVLIVVAIAAVAIAWLVFRRRQEGAHACALCDRSFDSAHDLETHLLEHARIERPTLAP